MLKNVALQSNGGVATASSYDGINVPSNANNGSTAVGNGNNWYSTVTNPKLMITFDNIYSINKVKLFTTDTWGNSFSDFDLYYTTNDSLTVNDPVASFQSIGHFSSATWKNAMGSAAFSPVSAKKILLIPNGTGLALAELEVYTSPSIKTLNDQLNIGDFIPCKYTASTDGVIGVLGTFSEMGTTTAAFIPETSSSTPNGAFYWIYVGKDYLGRKKFIADRNIQHSISWDTINAKGMSSGVTVDFGLGNKYNTIIRLMSGGTSTTDTEDEWDKIIVNSNLNNTITTSDNSIWNWKDIYSWTSTTLPSASDNRIIRGSVSCSQFNNNASNAAASSIGFRPVLLIETLRTVKYLLRKDSNYYAIASNYYDTTNHIFTPLTLAGGTTPNESDVDSFGFTDLNLITNNMTAGSDTFRPIDKFTDNFDLELYLS
jgi:hypothetical protein